ncbi:complex I NDUFA9 subunit family protein [Alphaproteobacteria bacterium]|nr:complex I NDUFA9 subunit family protein [Alphaproteobacteria bacterium]
MDSIKNKKIIIFGGTGFLGNALVETLSKENVEIYLLARDGCNRKDLKKYRTSSNIKIIDWKLNDLEILEKCLKEVNCVINLCGILYENKNGDFDEIHSDFPCILGELSKKNNIKNFIHVSALGVSESSNSKYSRSKASGDRRLLEKFPKAKILRPSILFGKGDNFFGQFSQIASISPFVPLISKNIRFQPVFVNDVVLAIIKLIANNDIEETIFDLGGKNAYTFKDLLKILLNIKGIKRFFIPLSPNLMMIPALFLERLPKPPFTVDQMKLLKHDNVLSGDFPGLNELGIEPADMTKELIKIYSK